MPRVPIHINSVQRRNDVFLPEHLDTFYTLDRFHINGSRILSRSFHVEPFAEDEDEGEEEPASMDVDLEHMETDSQTRQKTGGEEGTTDTEENEEDECEGVADVAMTPMADILNARNGCDNVRLYLLCLASHIDILSGTPILRERYLKHGGRQAYQAGRTNLEHLWRPTKRRLAA
jgi:hypothetical protein